jgi:hypothetical protein
VELIKNRIAVITAVVFAITGIGLSPALAVDVRVIDIVTVTWPGAPALPADANKIANLINTEVNADWKKFTTLYGDPTDRTISFVSGKILETPISLASKMPCSGLAATNFLDAVRPDAFRKLGVTDYSKRYLLIVAPKAGCIWSGRANMGSYRSTNGTIVVHDIATSFVITHEIGHTFGLGHTNFLRCANGDADGIWGDACKAVEYGGTIDVMGNADTSSPLSTYHQWRMRLLGDDQVKQVWQSDVINLAPSDFAKGIKAIYVRDGKSAYWIEYRRTLEGVRYKPGLVIFRLDPPPASAVVSPNTEDEESEFDAFLGTDVWMLNLDSYVYRDSRSVGGSMTGLTATTYNGKVAFSAVPSETGAVVTIKRTADTTPPPVPVVIPAAQWKSPAMSILKEDNEDVDTAIVGYESQIDGKVAALKATDVERWQATYLSPFIAPKTVYLKDLPEGSYSFSVRAIDMQGNKSEWSKPEQVVIDRGYPVVTNNFVVSNANANQLTVAWKGATDTGAGICQINVVDEDELIIQSTSVKNAPAFTVKNGAVLTGTAQVFDCVGNGQSGELSITNTFIPATKSTRTGKWVAANASFGTGSLKCVGKCTASMSTSGKFDLLIGAGAATIAVGGKTVASVSDSKAKSLMTSGTIDAGATKKVVRVSGNNFVLIGLAAVTTSLGQLQEIEQGPATIDPSLSDPKQAKLAKLGFRAEDFSNSWSVLPMSGGTTLVDPSLDLCGGTFASEKERVERRQVLALKEDSTFAFLSTEVVKYSSAAAASAAQKELVKVLAQCQAEKGYKNATGTLVPYDFKSFKAIPAGVVADNNRVFVHAVIDSDENARTLLGFYQFNGDTYTGLYVLNTKGFSDAQVAKWLNVAVTMAARLQQK